MTIEYIALPGGGLDFFIFYGLIKHLNIAKLYDINNIKAIYGTSCGSILGLLLLLKLDWEVLDTYIIYRPWNKLFEISPDTLFNCISNKGLLTIDCFYLFFEPLFKTLGYELSITFAELYKKTNIDFNVFSTEYDTLTLAIFNKTNTPHLSVIEACYMSSTLIPLFQPKSLDNKYYIDGGVILNNPVTYLLEQQITDINDALLCIIDISYCKKKKITNFNVDNINKDSNLINFVLSLVLRLSNRIHDNLFKNTESLKKIKHTINISSTIKQHDINNWMNCIEDPNIREGYIKKGIEYAELFLNYKIK